VLWRSIGLAARVPSRSAPGIGKVSSAIVPSRSIPHPIPYQGSKRRLAARIVEYVPSGTRTLIEPFCGSAAITLASAKLGLASGYHLNDSLAPLAGLWRAILDEPAELARRYDAIWTGQMNDPRGYFDEIRTCFNHDHEPAKLLFLLARCVKNAVRFNTQGEFNQSPDLRRLGTRPARMRGEILGASALLSGRSVVTAGDYEVALDSATPRDVVYLDPPYQGTSGLRDRRYHQGLDRDRLVAALDRLRVRGVPVIVSFDGRTGDRTYGEDLPAELGLTRLELDAGVSTQATLTGRHATTFEALYVSPELARRR
jgi:DNA adenine methylase